jgi:hypothetical protein
MCASVPRGPPETVEANVVAQQGLGACSYGVRFRIAGGVTTMVVCLSSLTILRHG